MAPSGWLAGERYRLDDRIAAGGMGEVWRGRDLLLERPVAVKLLRPEYAQHPDALARFRAEARHAGSLPHPAIAQVYDYCEAEPPHTPYLVMELVDGPSLAALLKAGPLDAARAMGVISQAASGLQAAHAAGVVHRDVKPGNLLLTRNDQVKITDFGIAHAAGSAPITITGALMGTPAYLAPERAAGASATPATDLYALGVIAYECLAGRLPFEGDPLSVALAHQLQDLPPLPPSVPPAVADLVTDLTARDPRSRPSSAGEVAARAGKLRAALAAGPAALTGLSLPVAAGAAAASTPLTPAPAPGEARGRPGRHQRRRRPARSLAHVALVLAGALGVGLAGWLLGSRFSPITVQQHSAVAPHRVDGGARSHGHGQNGGGARPHARRHAGGGAGHRPHRPHAGSANPAHGRPAVPGTEAQPAPSQPGALTAPPGTARVAASHPPAGTAGRHARPAHHLTKARASPRQHAAHAQDSPGPPRQPAAALPPPCAERRCGPISPGEASASRSPFHSPVPTHTHAPGWRRPAHRGPPARPVPAGPAVPMPGARGHHGRLRASFPAGADSHEPASAGHGQRAPAAFSQQRAWRAIV